MTFTRRKLLLASGATLALAGCLDDDPDDDDDTMPADDDMADDDGVVDDADDMMDDDADDGDDMPDDDDPDDVTVALTDHPDYGDILVDGEGMTLYNFDADTQGESESSCYDDCEASWPPLTVDDEPVAGDGVTAELTTFERDDGSMQVAANGWPLYYFAGDSEPGDTQGQGVNDVWWVMTAAGEPIRDDDDDEPGNDADDEEMADDDDAAGGSPYGY